MYNFALKRSFWIKGRKLIMVVIGDTLCSYTYYTLLLVECRNRLAQVGIY